jgi:GT2 family glycosyltransferase
MEISIIIVTYNSAKDIEACLRSLESDLQSLKAEIFVVDNISKDETVEIVSQRFPHVNLIQNRDNVGFPGANNQAIALARAKYLLLLNPDTIVLPGAINAMVGFMEKNPDCGVLGPLLLNADGTPAADLRKPTLLLTFLCLIGCRKLINRRHLSGMVDIVSGACLMIKADLVPIVGMLDDQMHSYEDTDFCIRVKQCGFKIYKYTDARIIHLVGQSAKSNIEFTLKRSYSSQIRYHKKHSKSLTLFLIISLIWIQAILRYSKFVLLSLLRGSAEIKTKKSALRRVVFSLPGMTWD